MTMAQQTAVDWLVEEVNHYKLNESLTLERLYQLKQQAKQIEKEQAIQDYLTGMMHPLEMDAMNQAEQYYNEKYGK